MKRRKNMDFSTHKPVQIVIGDNCIQNNASLLALGKKALIVSGRNGADACGAISDITAALEKCGVAYARYPKITENPPAPVCHEGGAFCRSEGCDFIIAVGGGSPLDAGKAIAAYANNPEMDVMDIYDGEKMINPCLPIIAFPTTAGTGSEAAPYAVLTIDDGLRKKTFKHATSYPKYSFVDPKYTYTLSKDYSVSTALDALAHAIESYLSPKANSASREAAAFAATEVWTVLFENADAEGEKDAGDFTRKQRERLMYAACAAGIAISYTGTGFPHPLGYSLTLTYGIPHGKACALFEGEYISYNRLSSVGSELLEELAEKIGCSLDDMITRIPAKADCHIKLTAKEAEALIDRVAGAGNYANSPYVITRGEMSDIYTRLFVK